MKFIKDLYNRIYVKLSKNVLIPDIIFYIMLFIICIWIAFFG